MRKPFFIAEENKQEHKPIISADVVQKNKDQKTANIQEINTSQDFNDEEDFFTAQETPNSDAEISAEKKSKKKYGDRIY